MKKSTYSSSIQKLLTDLGDFIFPPSSAEKLLRTIEPSTSKTLFQPGRHKNITYLCRYTEPIVQAAITANKFHHHRGAAQLLGSMLERWVSTQDSETLLIPIPLGQERLRQRGHNQVETILRSMSLPIETNTKVLRRSVETAPQSQLKKSERVKNMRQVFECTVQASFFLNYSQIILLDDVVTTGATMQAARATLAPHLPPNVSLTCLALAH